MSYGLWLSAGGLQVNQYRQELLANNLANVETAGFKRDLAVIHERPVESRTRPGGAPFADRLLDRLSGGQWVRPTYTAFEQGGLVHTGGALDAAIQGPGFFSVQEGAQTRYTRDGRLTLNPADELVLAAGSGTAKVLDAGGQPITLDRAGGEVNFAEDGTIHQNGRTVGRLGVVEFDNPQGLRKTGGNLFAAVSVAPTPAEHSTVHGGFVERSNQDPLTGLVKMIEVTRAHELNARMISLQDETLGMAASRIGRIS